jgi:DNA-binding transcriptional LysR family regulator
VVALLRRGSPGSKVVIHALGPGQDYLRMLSDGDMDLVIANWDEPPAHLHISKLFEDPIICTMRADSPYARRTAPDAMTLEDYLDLPHVAPTQMLPGYHGVIDAHLERLGLQRRVAVESPYFGVIPYMLTQSDLVLTTGRQFIRAFEKTLPLKSFTVPVKFPPMRFYQLWHQRVHQSTEHKWLRDQVSSAARALVQG